MRCFGLESISWLGSFLAAESYGTSGLDRLLGGAYILTEWQSLFVPYGFALLLTVHYSDANHHMPHKLDKQAISLYFASAFAQSEQSKTWLGIKTGMEGWLSSRQRRAAR